MESASTPSISWYQSSKGIILLSLVLPPVGLLLLWLNRDLETGKKVYGSLGIAALGAFYVYMIFGGSSVITPPNSDAHYAELERQRAEQREKLPTEGQNAGSASATNGNAAIAVASSNSNANESTAPTVTAKVARNYWTNFRGPARDGHYDESNILTQWPPQGLTPVWKQPIGGGYASFVVADGTAFTIEQRRNQEVVAAYDLETGRELWTNAWDAEFVESMGGDGPRATPTWDTSRIYALGAVGELRCIEAKTGKAIWSRNILSDNGAQNLQWGMSGAPLIVDDKVIVLPGGTSGKSVVAYNKHTGAPVWRSLNDRAGYTSPMLVTLAGKRQILVVTSTRMVGLEIGDGALLWSYPWDAQINISQPIVIDKNRVFISAGYGKGAALVEVSGNGASFEARKIWENSLMKNKFNSSVIYNGYVYGLNEGILTCLDIETGERKWQGGRYGYGQLVLASGHLIVITEQGELVLVKATPDQHTELAKFAAIEGKTWNNPALADGRLLVRNQTQMACFNLNGK
ncbi:MAG: PQQ-binding-like beta-propeller repeat protein [Blastocatellia bacterium]